MTLRFSGGVPGRLEPIDVTLNAGELTAIVGPNGAGKSTLIRALAGLMPTPPLLDGRPLIAGPSRGRALGYLPQGAASHWDLRVDALAALGRLPHGDAAAPTGLAAIADALAQTALTAFAGRTVSTLSGGEAARAHLARVLAGQPRFILADEPTAQLDPAHALDVMTLLAAAAARGLGVAVVMHDLPLAAMTAGRMIWLHDGRIAADGSPRDTLTVARMAAVFGVRARVERDGAAVTVSVIGRA